MLHVDTRVHNALLGYSLGCPSNDDTWNVVSQRLFYRDNFIHNMTEKLSWLWSGKGNQVICRWPFLHGDDNDTFKYSVYSVGWPPCVSFLFRWQQSYAFCKRETRNHLNLFCILNSSRERTYYMSCKPQPGRYGNTWFHVLCNIMHSYSFKFLSY